MNFDVNGAQRTASETGRQHPPGDLRANKSVKLRSLRRGLIWTANVDYLKRAGYIWTTAVYGNGNFGIADWAWSSGLQPPLLCQMAAVYVLDSSPLIRPAHCTPAVT